MRRGGDQSYRIGPIRQMEEGPPGEFATWQGPALRFATNRPLPLAWRASDRIKGSLRQVLTRSLHSIQGCGFRPALDPPLRWECINPDSACPEGSACGRTAPMGFGQRQPTLNQ